MGLGFVVDLSQGDARLNLDPFSAVLVQLLVVSVLLLQGLAFERPKVFFHVAFVSLPNLTLDEDWLVLKGSSLPTVHTPSARTNGRLIV